MSAALARFRMWLADALYELSWRVRPTADITVDGALDIALPSSVQPGDTLVFSIEYNDGAFGHYCYVCGEPLQLVRPGKWKCPNAPHTAEKE